MAPVGVDNAFQKCGKKIEIIVLLSQNNFSRFWCSDWPLWYLRG